MNPNITLRRATEQDFLPTERLAKEAFTDRSRLPGPCDENYILHCMRKMDDYIPELDYVATDNATGAIVGQITWTHAAVEAPDGTLHPAVTFGPVSVLPSLQSKGIGSALIRHTLALAKQMGFTRAVLMGHPAYYPRFGFERGEKYGITDGEGNTHDACMVLALEPGAFTGVQGRIVESAAFHCKPEDVARFNAQQVP